MSAAARSGLIMTGHDQNVMPGGVQNSGTCQAAKDLQASLEEERLAVLDFLYAAVDNVGVLPVLCSSCRTANAESCPLSACLSRAEDTSISRGKLLHAADQGMTSIRQHQGWWLLITDAAAAASITG